MNSTFEIIEGKLAKVNESTLPAVRSEDMEAILAEYSPHVVKAVELCALAESVKVTSETDTAWMAKAKDLRKQIASTRIEAEKARKFLKEESLRKGQIIDAIYREFEKVVKPIEKSLEESEKFAELAKARREAELQAKREAELAPYLTEGESVHQYGTLSAMSENAFQQALAGAKLAKEQRDAERAEIERIEKEKAEADAKERQRLAEENAKLRAQAEIERKSREEAEAKLREAQVSAKVEENERQTVPLLAKTVDAYVKKYGEEAVEELLSKLSGAVSKQLTDDERLEVLVTRENTWKTNR